MPTPVVPLTPITNKAVGEKWTHERAGFLLHVLDHFATFDPPAMENRRAPRPIGRSFDIDQEPLAPHRRVLIIDDDLDYLHSMATLLRAKGHEVGLAVNATVALSVARVFRPDTVMLDVKLPNGDGRMLAAQLRREVGLEDMRIVCVTGYAEEDPRKSLESGCD